VHKLLFGSGRHPHHHVPQRAAPIQSISLTFPVAVGLTWWTMTDTSMTSLMLTACVLAAQGVLRSVAMMLAVPVSATTLRAPMLLDAHQPSFHREYSYAPIWIFFQIIPNLKMSCVVIETVIALQHAVFVSSQNADTATTVPETDGANTAMVVAIHRLYVMLVIDMRGTHPGFIITG